MPPMSKRNRLQLILDSNLERSQSNNRIYGQEKRYSSSKLHLTNEMCSFVNTLFCETWPMLRWTGTEWTEHGTLCYTRKSRCPSASLSATMSKAHFSSFSVCAWLCRPKTVFGKHYIINIMPILPAIPSWPLIMHFAMGLHKYASFQVVPEV